MLFYHGKRVHALFAVVVVGVVVKTDEQRPQRFGPEEKVKK